MAQPEDSFTIELFLSRLRAAHPDMETLFLHGSCYELFNVMRVMWPKAEPWYVVEEGHVYVKVGPWFYDIRGKHRRLPPGKAVNLLQPYSSDRPHRWSKRHLHRLRLPPETVEGEPPMSTQPAVKDCIIVCVKACEIDGKKYDAGSWRRVNQYDPSVTSSDWLLISSIDIWAPESPYKGLTITAAAIRVPVRTAGTEESNHLIISMPRPFRHPDILRRMHMMGISENHPDDQGFLASDGKFYDRDDSMVIAIAANQIKNGEPISDTLTSEDLW